ncbi:MAG: hypothetical protein ABR947_02595 [Solirubrobacteraceae bacterium]
MSAQPPPREGSRARWPGSRRAVALGAAALLAAALAVCVALVAGGGGSPPTVDSAKYGGIPSWLPKPKVPVDRVVQASPTHPWLGIEGDTISVELAGGHILATAVGPAVPEEGHFPVPATSPCTFTVTLTVASGRVPLSAASFTILDELSHLHLPHVTVAGGTPLPRFLTAGRTLTVIVKDVLPTGGGQLRWAPAGSKPVASWDFDVEID